MPGLAARVAAVRLLHAVAVLGRPLDGQLDSALKDLAPSDRSLARALVSGALRHLPGLDALIDGIRIEPDLAKRRALTADALRLMHAELPLVPLYRRTLTWVMRPNVHVAPLPNDVLELRWVRID